MKLALTRNSVAAGDDLESHDREMIVEDGMTLGQIIEAVIASRYLPSVAGPATWSVWTAQFGSSKPVAVVTQDSATAKLLPRAGYYDPANASDLALRFVYQGQTAPQAVEDVLKRV